MAPVPKEGSACLEGAGDAYFGAADPLGDGKVMLISEPPLSQHRKVFFDVDECEAKKPSARRRSSGATVSTSAGRSLNFCSDGTTHGTGRTVGASRSSFSRSLLEPGTRCRASLASLASRRSARSAAARRSPTESQLKKWRLLTWMQNFKVNYDDLTKGEAVGGGSTANVHRGKFKQEAPADMVGEEEQEGPQTDVAIKVFLFDEREYEQLAKALVREIEALTTLNHDNLVRLIGVVETPPCIVMEFCHGGALYDLLYKSAYRVQWEQQLKIACDIAEAMEYLHSLEPPIIHRDLKSLNCLLDEPVVSTDCEPLVKVADFGMATRWLPFRKMTRAVGTCHWMAPEVATGTDYEAAADVFSYGMMLYEIFRLEVPFRDRSPNEVSKLLSAGHRPQIVQDEFPSECPEEIISLLTECWAQDPDRRPNFEHIVETLDPDLGSDVDDEDFVESAWWRSPTSCGFEAPIARRVCDADDGSDALGCGPDEVIWARTYPSDGWNPPADLGSDVDDEGCLESAWWQTPAHTPSRRQDRLPARTHLVSSVSDEDERDPYLYD